MTTGATITAICTPSRNAWNAVLRRKIVRPVELADLARDVAFEQTDTDEEAEDRGDERNLEGHQEVPGDHE